VWLGVFARKNALDNRNNGVVQLGALRSGCCLAVRGCDILENVARIPLAYDFEVSQSNKKRFADGQRRVSCSIVRRRRGGAIGFL